MTHPRTLRGPTLWLGLTLFCAAAAALAAPVPSPDKLLASDTLVVLTMPDYAKARTTLDRWPASKLWNDPSMKAFKDKLTTKFQSEFIAPLERELGVKLTDYADLAQGQLTFALTQSGWDGQPDSKPGWLLLVDSRDKSAALKSSLATLKQKWIDGGKTVRPEKIRDVEFTAFVLSSDDIGKALEKAAGDKGKNKEDADAGKKPASKTEMFVGQSDSLLILGSSPKDIEKILVRQSGGGVPALGEQANFSSSYNSQFRDALGYGWLNLKTIVDTFIKQAGKGGGNAEGGMLGGFTPEKVLSALGLTGLNTAAMSLSDTPEGSLAQFFLSVPEANRKGLFKLFAAEQRESGPTPFIPADANKFSRYRLDLKKAFAIIEGIAIEVNPQLGGTMKMLMDMAGKDKDPNFDFRQSFVNNLGDDIISFQKPPKDMTLESLNSPPTLFLISSPKAEQLASAVKALGSFLPGAGGAKIKEREFLGRKVYSMSTGGGRGRAGRGGSSMNFAASGGYVALTTDASLLEEYLRGETAKPLSATPGLAEAAQRVGGLSTGMFGFENQAESMRTALAALKNDSGSIGNLLAATPFGGLSGEEGEKKVKEWVDFSLLPEFEKVSKYFHYTVWAGAVNNDGLSFKAFSPIPPGMKK